MLRVYELILNQRAAGKTISMREASTVVARLEIFQNMDTSLQGEIRAYMQNRDRENSDHPRVLDLNDNHMETTWKKSGYTYDPRTLRDNPEAILIAREESGSPNEGSESSEVAYREMFEGIEMMVGRRAEAIRKDCGRYMKYYREGYLPDRVYQEGEPGEAGSPHELHMLVMAMYEFLDTPQVVSEEISAGDSEPWVLD